MGVIDLDAFEEAQSRALCKRKRRVRKCSECLRYKNGIGRHRAECPFEKEESK